MQNQEISLEELLNQLDELKRENENLRQKSEADTERFNLLEADLSEYKDRFEIVMQAANFAWWELDVLTGNVKFSERKAEMLGYSPSDFGHYKDFMALVHPDDYDKTMQAMIDHYTGIAEKYDAIYRIKTSSGEYTAFHDIGRITQRNSNGKPMTVKGIVIDVINSITLAEVQKENEQRFRQMVQSHRSIMLLIDADTLKIVDANPSAAEFYGYSLDELRGMSMEKLNVLSPDEIEKLKNLVLHGGHSHFELLHRKSTGEIMIVESNSSIIEINNRKLFFSIVNDITERRKVEDELKKSSEALQKGEEIGKFGSWNLDLNEQIMRSSIGATKIYGLSKTENTLEEILDIALSEYRPILDAAFKNMLESQMPYNVEFQIQRKSDGRIIDIHSVANYDTANNIVFGTIQDITERKRIESALRESEERFKEIFDNSPIGIYRTNREGRILLANPKLIEMLGFSTFEDLQTRNIKNYGYEHQEIREEFIAEIETKCYVNNFEAVWKKKDGSDIIVNEYSHLVKSPDGKVLFYEGTVEDITERKKAEEALKIREQEFRAVFEQAASGVAVIYSKTGRFRNYTGCKLTI